MAPRSRRRPYRVCPTALRREAMWTEHDSVAIGWRSCWALGEEREYLRHRSCHTATLASPVGPSRRNAVERQDEGNCVTVVSLLDYSAAYRRSTRLRARPPQAPVTVEYR